MTGSLSDDTPSPPPLPAGCRSPAPPPTSPKIPKNSAVIVSTPSNLPGQAPPDIEPASLKLDLPGINNRDQGSTGWFYFNSTSKSEEQSDLIEEFEDAQGFQLS